MTGLILWKDQEIERLRKDVDRTFRRFCRDLRVPIAPLVADTTFTTDLSETDDALIFTATLPGIHREDMTISVTENTLTIEAKSADQIVEETSGYRRVTEQAKTFLKNIRLPRSVDIDRIEASFNEDVLKIVMPKLRKSRKTGVHIPVK